METIFNRALSLNPRTPFYLNKLDNKSLMIKIDTFFTTKIFFLIWSKQGIRQVNDLETFPDATIAGPLKAFLNFTLTRNPRSATQLGLTFSGDTETLEYTQQLFSTLSIDWEEYLSQWTGDILATQISQLWRTMKKTNQAWFNNTKQSLGEYLKEELKVLPTRVEINHFLDTVDALRTNVDRLEARLDYLASASAKETN